MTLDDEQLRSLAEDAVEHMEPPAGEQRSAHPVRLVRFGPRDLIFPLNGRPDRYRSPA